MTRALRLLPAFAVLLLLPMQAHADVLVYCSNLPGCGPLRDFVPGLLNQLLLRFDVYAYILGALFIMIGGAYMLMSGFNEEYMTKGKNTIIWAVVGIFTARFASQFVSFINLEVGSVGGGDLVASGISAAIGTIFDLLYIGLLAIALFCGMRMVISRGQEDAFKKAQNGLFYAAIGAIIINIAELLANAISTL